MAFMFPIHIPQYPHLDAMLRPSRLARRQGTDHKEEKYVPNSTFNVDPSQSWVPRERRRLSADNFDPSVRTSTILREIRISDQSEEESVDVEEGGAAVAAAAIAAAAAASATVVAAAAPAVAAEEPVADGVPDPTEEHYEDEMSIGSDESINNEFPEEVEEEEVEDSEEDNAV